MVVLAAALLIAAAATHPDLVSTVSGRVSGVAGHDPTVTVFKGIPFAAPPVGDMRWRPPGPAPHWDGERKADSFGDICMQRQPPQMHTPMSENCLFLNVWTSRSGADVKKPVFVWIYGGRFIFGAGSQPDYDGEGLAKKGLVVVTLNYRTGVFGFLATPELSEESGHNASGNYGLLDQIAALKWVQDNIAAFGGEPNNVTVAGQSAGAASVLQLIDSPLAKGLFKRAIPESGALYPNDPLISGLAPSWRPLREAEAAGAAYAERAGAKSLAALRMLPADRLMVENNLDDETVQGRPPLFRPVVDGWVVPKSYGDTLRGGTQNDVAVLTGYNLDEAGAETQIKLTLVQYKAQVATTYGAMADQFLQLYPATSDAAATAAWKSAARDSVRVSSWLWGRLFDEKRRGPVYTYYWTHVPGSPEGSRRGAYHGAEINFAFNNLYAVDAPWTADDRRIADIVSTYWVNFAKSGNPNGPGLPVWNPVHVEPSVMEIGDEFAPRPLADAARRAFFEQFFKGQRSW